MCIERESAYTSNFRSYKHMSILTNGHLIESSNIPLIDLFVEYIIYIISAVKCAVD